MKHASPLLEALWAEPRAFSPYEAMLDLINLAARRATAVKVGREKVLLERGELVTSEPALAARWHWSRKAVRTFLAKRRHEGELLGTTLGSKKQGSGTKLSLVNYETYAPHGPKGAKHETQAKSSERKDIADNGNSRGAKQPPQTPRGVVQPPLSLERSRPLRGSGGGVADARDVEKPSTPQLELPPPVAPINPEHLEYAEALADALNFGQLENNAGIDRDTYRPVEAWHPRTLEAALAIRNAGVPLLFATTYARTEASKYKPSARHAQIASVAYVQGGCLRAWSELQQHQRPRVEAHRPRIPSPLAVGNVLAGVLRDVRGEGAS